MPQRTHALIRRETPAERKPDTEGASPATVGTWDYGTMGLWDCGGVGVWGRHTLFCGAECGLTSLRRGAAVSSVAQHGAHRHKRGGYAADQRPTERREVAPALRSTWPCGGCQRAHVAFGPDRSVTLGSVLPHNSVNANGAGQAPTHHCSLVLPFLQVNTQSQTCSSAPSPLKDSTNAIPICCAVFVCCVAAREAGATSMVDRIGG